MLEGDQVEGGTNKVAQIHHSSVCVFSISTYMVLFGLLGHYSFLCVQLGDLVDATGYTGFRNIIERS